MNIIAITQKGPNKAENEEEKADLLKKNAILEFFYKKFFKKYKHYTINSTIFISKQKGICYGEHKKK